jgi:glucan biosynthesis protein C
MQRTFSLDNLRTCLTGLVIVHHASIPYGGLGIWPYTSPYHTSGSSIPLVAFNVVNQSFFMGSFFLLSGYFSSIAARRRTRGEFLKEKVKRLGVPMVVYSVLSRGVIEGILVAKTGGEMGDVLRSMWLGMKSVRGVRGPVWYCALVLVFDTMYTLLRPEDFAGKKVSAGVTFTRPSSKPGPTKLAATRKISSLGVLGTLTLTATTCFFARLIYPIGTVFKPLSLQLGYAPQYVFYYTAGIWVHRHLQQDLHAVVSPKALLQAGASAVLVTIFGLQQLLGRSSNGVSVSDSIELMEGGCNRFAGFTISVALLKIFASLEVLKRKWEVFGVDSGKYSYAAFLLHVPLLVDTQSRLNEDVWKGSSTVLKAAYVGLIGIGKSWVFGWLLKEVLDKVGFRGYV